ncbi:MAG: hypothetical protein ACYCPT_03925 [Acidimicrobiales bacterium]
MDRFNCAILIVVIIIFMFWIFWEPECEDFAIAPYVSDRFPYFRRTFWDGSQLSNCDYCPTKDICPTCPQFQDTTYNYIHRIPPPDSSRIPSGNLEFGTTNHALMKDALCYKGPQYQQKYGEPVHNKYLYDILYRDAMQIPEIYSGPTEDTGVTYRGWNTVDYPAHAPYKKQCPV